MALSRTDRAAPLRHVALFYRSMQEYGAAAADFLRSGTSAGERLLVAVPGHHERALHDAADGDLEHAACMDMASMGRNPSRILPVLHQFIAGVDPLASQTGSRVIGEPIWPGRTDPEVREATRLEALINLALADTSTTIMCPYDVTGLPASVLDDARRTHPVVVSGGQEEASVAYIGPDSVPASCNLPLTPPPAGADQVAYDVDLQPVRQLVATCVSESSLPQGRVVDFVLAVSEVAANTLRHTRAGGTARVWRTADEVICQIDDTGHITDPLAGHRPPDPDRGGGYGLWLVNRSCDLTEMRTSAQGTSTRMHMRLASGNDHTRR